jgi:hypothetical protein
VGFDLIGPRDWPTLNKYSPYPTMAAQRRGMSNAERADNAVAFLNRIKARSEDKGVT